MKNLLNQLPITIYSVLFILLTATTGFAVDVQLSVKERAGVDRINEPVTYGVPLSQDDNITSVNVLQITDSDGGNIPAQFRVLSRYHGEVDNITKPIRSVLVNFKTDVNANQTKLLYLKNNGSGTVSGSDLVSETTSEFVIDTSNLQLKISKTNFFNLI